MNTRKATALKMAEKIEVQCEPEIKKRFAELTEDEIDQLSKPAVRKNTRLSTESAVKTLQKFCQKKSIFEDWNDLTKAGLNNLLREFYASARQVTGELYKLNSLNSLRHGLQRYFLENNKVDIINDGEFLSANTIWKNVASNTKEAGKGNTKQYYAEIEPEV